MVSGVFSIPLDVPQPTSLRRPRAWRAAQAASAQYIAGPENALVHVAASFLPGWDAGDPPQLPVSPIYLYGPSGTAKTELGRALTALWQNSHPNLSLVATTGSAFLRTFTLAASHNGLAQWQGGFQDASLLFLDDVDRLAGRRATEEMLVRLVDQYLADDRPVLITGAVHPASHPNLSPRLASRLSGGLAIPLQKPGFQARCEILRQLAAAHGVACSADAVQYAANRLESTVPELSEFVRQLVSTGSSPAIEEADVRRALAQKHSPGRKISPDVIIRAVARYSQLSLGQLTGSSRRQSLVHARAIAVYLIRQSTAISLQQIGEYFGGRDHTTVLHAYRKAELLVEKDPATRRAVCELLSSIHRGAN